MRADFNVPLNDAGEITDDTRIQASRRFHHPTQKRGRKGRSLFPPGSSQGPAQERVSLSNPSPLASVNFWACEVAFANDCIGEESRRCSCRAFRRFSSSSRKHPLPRRRNSQRTQSFAKALAGTAEIFVNDAFGTAHRAHASTEGVTHLRRLKARWECSSNLRARITSWAKVTGDPERPLLVIMGGAKVSDKIEVITALLDKADTILIGGAMAYTFRKAQGHKVGMSLVEDDKLDLALDILKKAEEKGRPISSPRRHPHHARVQGRRRNQKHRLPYADGGEIPEDWEGIDIGSVAIGEFKAVIAKAKTILWNGPMGVFEIDSFATGTKEIAEAVAASDALSIVGGGDSVTAANKFGVADRMTFISTGGGASLELLEGKVLPGIDALSDA